MNPIDLYFDGLCEPDRPGGPRNPGGRACCGYIVRERNSQKIVAQGSACIGRGAGMTNNVAEYEAMIAGLKALIDQGLTDRVVIVKGDSQLVIQQMTGAWRVKAARISELHARAQELAAQFHNIDFRWVPREQNIEADELSRQAYLDAGPNAAGL